MNQTRTKPTSLAATAFCATISQSVSSSRQDLPSKTLMALIHYIKWLIQKESNMETSISMADFYEKYLNENLNLIDVREVHLTRNIMSSVKVESVPHLLVNF